MKVELAVCGTKNYFGLPKYFYFLAKHLRQKGIDVEIIVDSGQGVDHLHEVLGLALLGYGSVTPVVISPACQGKFNAVSTALWCWRVSQYLKKKQFDVLHCGHITPFFYLMQPRRKPVVFQPFDNELLKFGKAFSGIRGRWYRAMGGVLEYCGKTADVLLAEGDWQLDEVKELYGRDDSIVSPQGIDIEWIQQVADANPITRASLGLDDSDFVLLTVNGFQPMKNYQLLVEAIRLLPPNVKAIMVGTGTEDVKIDRLIADYGLRSRIARLRNVPESELYGLYRIADCYVSPTLVTDIQMGIIEAMCFGLPIVSTAQEYMIDGNGFVVAMDDSSALADGIVRVMMSDRRTMGLNSKELSRQYDFAKIAEKAIEIYKGL